MMGIYSGDGLLQVHGGVEPSVGNSFVRFELSCLESVVSGPSPSHLVAPAAV